jgi:hypothetical protein
VRIQQNPQCHNHCATSIDNRFLQETREADIAVSPGQFRVVGIQQMVANNGKRKVTFSPLTDNPQLSADAKTMMREYALTLYPGYDWVENK